MIVVTSRRGRCRWRPRTIAGRPGAARGVSAGARRRDRGVPEGRRAAAAARHRGIGRSGGSRAGQHAAAAAYYERRWHSPPGNVAAHHYLTHAGENAGQVDKRLEHGAQFAKAGARDSARASHARPQPAARRARLRGDRRVRGGRSAAPRVRQAREDPARIRLALRAQPRSARRPRSSTSGR